MRTYEEHNRVTPIISSLMTELRDWDRYVNAYEFTRLLMQLMVWHKLSALRELNTAFPLLEKLTLTSFRRSEMTVRDLKDYFQNLSQHWECFQTEVPSRMPDDVLLRVMKSISLLDGSTLSYADLLEVFALLLRGKRRVMILAGEWCELMLALTGVQPGERIYNPFANYFELAFQAAHLREVQLVSEDAPQEEFSSQSLLHCLQALEQVTWTHHFSDPLQSPSCRTGFQLEQFDRAVSCIPFGLVLNQKEIVSDPYDRFDDLLQFPNLSGESACIQHILKQTSKTAVLLVPQSFIARESPSEQAFKEYLLKQGVVWAVIMLPEGTFYQFSSGQTHYLLLLDKEHHHDEVLFINGAADEFIQQETVSGLSLDTRKILDLVRRNAHEATNWDSIHEAEESYRTRSLPTENWGYVAQAALRDNHFNWMPERYLIPEHIRQQTRWLYDRETRTLEDCGELIRSQMLKDEEHHPEALPVQEVMVLDLPPSGWITQASKTVRVSPKSLKSAKRYSLKPYDLLIVIKGRIAEVGMVGDIPGEEIWVAGQAFQIIRLPDQNKKNEAIVLLMFLKSGTGQTLLRQMSTGSNTQVILSRSLKTMPVPVLTEVEKSAVIARFHQERDLIRQIQSLHQQIERLHETFLPGS
ncbi:MAG: N-6 DNA methylase [SAR324 cluster bacterium]|nr:N-6 DNA methylase [SAR324 cluster bacterium]